MDSQTYLTEIAKAEPLAYNAASVPLDYFSNLLMRLEMLGQEVSALQQELFQGKPNKHHAAPWKDDTGAIPTLADLPFLQAPLLQGALGFITEGLEMLIEVQNIPLDDVRLREGLADLERYRALLYNTLAIPPELMQQRSLDKAQLQLERQHSASTELLGEDLIADILRQGELPPSAR